MRLCSNNLTIIEKAKDRKKYPKKTAILLSLISLLDKLGYLITGLNP